MKKVEYSRACGKIFGGIEVHQIRIYNAGRRVGCAEEGDLLTLEMLFKNFPENQCKITITCIHEYIREYVRMYISKIIEQRIMIIIPPEKVH